MVLEYEKTSLRPFGLNITIQTDFLSIQSPAKQSSKVKSAVTDVRADSFSVKKENPPFLN